MILLFNTEHANTVTEVTATTMGKENTAAANATGSIIDADMPNLLHKCKGDGNCKNECTTEDCVKMCSNKTFKERKTACTDLCSSCIGTRWNSTALPGGAFSTKLACFEHFSATLRPKHLYKSKQKC